MTSDTGAILEELQQHLQNHADVEGDALQDLYKRADDDANGDALIKLGILIEQGGDLCGQRYFDGKKQETTCKMIPSKLSATERKRFAFFKTAKSAYLKAREKGHPDAAFRLGRLLYKGYFIQNGWVLDETSAMTYLREAADSMHQYGMVWVASILVEKHRGSIDKAQAMHLYEKAASKGSATAMYNLAMLMSTEPKRAQPGYMWDEHGFYVSVDEEVWPSASVSHRMRDDPSVFHRSKELLLYAAARGHRRAMFQLGVVYQYGYLGETSNDSLAAAWYMRADEAGLLWAARKLTGSMKGVVPDFSTSDNIVSSSPTQVQEKENPNRQNLQTALLIALAAPTRLTIEFLVDAIQARNVTSAGALFAGHNLVLLAIRSCVITRVNLSSMGETSWFLRDNLYAPAVKLTSDGTDIINAVFMHAETVGIIPDGYCLKLAREIRVDSDETFRQAGKMLNDMYARMEDVEKRVGVLEHNDAHVKELLDMVCKDVNTLQKAQIETQEAVENLGSNMGRLRSLLLAQRQREMYAGLSSVILSLVPFIGGALGASATAAVSIFGLSAGDIVDTASEASSVAVSEMINVDISNFQIASFAFSTEALSKLSADRRNQLEAAAKKGGFKDCTEFQQVITHQIRNQSREKSVAHFLDIQSKEWTKFEAREITTEAPRGTILREKAIKLFHAHIHGRPDRLLSLRQAAEVLNFLLSDEHYENISLAEFKDWFYETSGEDDDMVSEDTFLAILNVVFDAKKPEKKLAVVKDKALAHFASRCDGEEAVDHEMARRILKSFLSFIVENGTIKEDPLRGDNCNAQEAIRSFEQDKNGLISMSAFVKGVGDIISGQISVRT